MVEILWSTGLNSSPHPRGSNELLWWARRSGVRFSVPSVNRPGSRPQATNPRSSTLSLAVTHHQVPHSRQAPDAHPWARFALVTPGSARQRPSAGGRGSLVEVLGCTSQRCSMTGGGDETERRTALGPVVPGEAAEDAAGLSGWRIAAVVAGESW